eukprot:719592-Pleurochrysis_carterae.AAC.1
MVLCRSATPVAECRRLCLCMTGAYRRKRACIDARGLRAFKRKEARAYKLAEQQSQSAGTAPWTVLTSRFGRSLKAQVQPPSACLLAGLAAVSKRRCSPLARAY